MNEIIAWFLKCPFFQKNRFLNTGITLDNNPKILRIKT
jgi:hypothetical protein